MTNRAPWPPGHGSRQRYRILAFVKRFHRENGYAPTFDQIGAAVGLASKSSVSKHLHDLQDEGKVEILGHRGVVVKK